MEKQLYGDEWDYKIDGKNEAVSRMVLTGVLAVAFMVLAVYQFGPGTEKLVFIGLALALFGAMLLGTFLQLAARYFCFCVYVGGRGFYFRTNPRDGRYCEYSEVASCRVETRSFRRAHSSETYSYSYFTFVLKSGEIKRFRFEEPIQGEAIEALKERIDANI